MAISPGDSFSAVSWSQIASTLPHIEGVIRNNVSDTTPLLSFLMGELGRAARAAVGIEGDMGSLPGVINGGTDFRVSVRLLKNTTPGSYSGADTIDVTHQDTDRYALFPIRQNAGSLVITGREKRSNKGEAAIYSLMKSKTDAITQDLKEELGTQCVSDGTGNGGKDVAGLEACIDTGTYAGLNPTTFPRWQPGGYASTDTRHGITTSAGAMARSVWIEMLNNLTFGMDRPDMFMMGQLSFQSYENALTVSGTTGQIHYSSLEVGDSSFSTLKFRTIPCAFDHVITTGTLYALNSRHVAFIRDTEADFVFIDDGTRPVDQDVFVKLMIVEGNVVTDNRRMLGKIAGITSMT